MPNLKSYYEMEILKLQAQIDEYNLQEENLFKDYRKEKDEGKLTEIGKIQLEKNFQKEIKRIRYYKKRLVDSLKVNKRKLEGLK